MLIYKNILTRKKEKSGVVVHAYNLSRLEANQEG